MKIYGVIVLYNPDNNNGNQGIAHALNVGAQKAIEDGADWLLTMD